MNAIINIMNVIPNWSHPSAPQPNGLRYDFGGWVGRDDGRREVGMKPASK